MANSIKIVRKADSRLMRLIGRLLPVYYRQVITTYGTTIYLPTEWERWPEEYRYLMLEHEKVHVRQQAKIPKLLYLFLYFLVLPIGWAPFRRRWEREAFEETIQIAAKTYGPAFVRHPPLREFVARQFYGRVYGWMWPNRKGVYAWLDRTIDQALKQA